LFMLTPAILVPYVDRLHSILLCTSSTSLQCLQLSHLLAVWLRPSRQIHAPIFNIKVRKKRRAIVSVGSLPIPWHGIDSLCRLSNTFLYCL
jgi:1,3-beta-glucan synthase